MFHPRQRLSRGTASACKRTRKRRGSATTSAQRERQTRTSRPFSMNLGSTARSARLYVIPPSPPFQTPAGDLHMPTDFRQPGRLSISGPRNPSLSGCGLLSPVREPRGLCVSRSLGICPYRCPKIRRPAAVRPHNAQDSTLTRGRLSIERYTTPRSASITRF